MKKRFILLSVIAIFLVTYANNSNAQAGFEVGYVNSVFKTKAGSTTTKGSNYNGFNAALTFDFPIGKYFIIQSGINYTLITNKDKQLLSDDKYTGHYGSVPLRLAFSYPFANNFEAFAYFGPNFILGVHGVIKSKNNITGIETDIDWYGEDGMDYNRFDIALGAGIGIQYRFLRLKFGYDWGLLNISKSDNVTLRRNQLGISLGVLF